MLCTAERSSAAIRTDHVCMYLLLIGTACSRSCLTSAFLCIAGHYIVVVAYCASSDSYEVRDPAAEAEHLTVPAAVLEAARRSFGTDEDIILVS